MNLRSTYCSRWPGWVEKGSLPVLSKDGDFRWLLIDIPTPFIGSLKNTLRRRRRNAWKDITFQGNFWTRSFLGLHVSRSERWRTPKSLVSGHEVREEEGEERGNRKSTRQLVSDTSQFRHYVLCTIFQKRRRKSLFFSSISSCVSVFPFWWNWEQDNMSTHDKSWGKKVR